MKIRYLLLLSLSAMLVSQSDAFAVLGSKKKKKAKTEVAKPQPSAYEKFLKEAKSQPGLFTVHKVGDKYFFEIPASLLKKEMLISSKVSESSDDSKVVAGQMQSNPKMIFFTHEDDKILLHEVVSKNICTEEQTITKSLQRNNKVPVSEIFKIIQKSPKDSSFVIEMNGYMLSDRYGFGIPENPFAMSKGPKLTPVNSMFGILDTKAFPKNVNVKCRLTYRAGDVPFEAIVTRSIVLLPEIPMSPRIADSRMNYFRTSKYQYDENEDKGKSLAYVNRWDLQPKVEDVGKYEAGELVEPAKPIVYYVDDALPEKWRKYIMQGIEDWQLAFEAIGFKNAIVARPFPKGDPNFNPEDIRYTCFRYITTPIANAMGPSWVDPRSGEIIQGSVYMYHNVLQLVHNWMFVQTAAANPAVRKSAFDEETMGRSLRYIASHEIGHTLGLMHNMKASAAYPVDSLRSATFTQKWGTTASIMDYARFNFVAQPEDKGVSFTPPTLGQYDVFAIKMGYQPIPEAMTPEAEYATLNKWLLEKSGDGMYVYGPQSFGLPLDPSAQSEDLGDDAIKASRYGIKNAKYIMDHLLEWTREEGRNFNESKEMYRALLGQYNNYTGHVMAYIGGAYLYQPVDGEGRPAYIPVSKGKQKEAVKFLFDEMKDQPKWMLRKDITDNFGLGEVPLSDNQSSTLGALMKFAMLNRIAVSNDGSEMPYTTGEYMDDIYKSVWAATLAGKNLDKFERGLQYNYVKNLLSPLGLTQASASSQRLNVVCDFQPGFGLPERLPEYSDAMEQSASAISSGKEEAMNVENKAMYLAYLNKVRTLLGGKLNSGDTATQNHYKYLYHEIGKALEK